MSTRLALLLLFALVAVFMPVIASAAQYYVSPTGSDSAVGTSAAPWQTLQHAADVVGPGDQVTARAGNYAGFYLDTSGTAAAPIVFNAKPGVLINQPNPIRTQHGINLENASYVTIDGFSVTGMERAGVRSVGINGNRLASSVTIRNVHSYNNGYWGIFTGFVNDLVIENNITSGSVNEHGIYVSNSGDRPVIRSNISFDNRGNGIHMNGDLSQGGDGIISNAVVSGNRIYNNGLGGGSGINMDGVKNSLIENNLLYGNHASGISLYKIDGASGSTGNIVVNNTISQANDARWAINIQNASTNNTILNNILVNAHSFRGAITASADSLSGLMSDYNAVMDRFSTDNGNTQITLAQWQAATGQDTHSVVVTPGSVQFADLAGNDYRLQSTSPAKNAGTSQLAPPADIEGLPRKAGAAYDIGAYEFGALAGDYNRDGSVTAADYVLWRKTLGASVIRFAGADGDGSGKIDQADFLRWRGGFGAVAATGTELATTVPEPSTVLLMFSGVVARLMSLRVQLR